MFRVSTASAAVKPAGSRVGTAAAAAQQRLDVATAAVTAGVRRRSKVRSVRRPSGVPIEVTPGARAAVGCARIEDAPYRMSQRARLAISITVLGAVAVVALSAALSSPSQTGAQVVTVRAGDSLWSIAQMVSANDDPRDVVDGIRALNQLPDAVVYPGQRLLVPR